MYWQVAFIQRHVVKHPALVYTVAAATELQQARNGSLHATGGTLEFWTMLC